MDNAYSFDETMSGLMVVFFTQVENTGRQADSLSWGMGRM